MPANVENMFSVRETPWHKLGTVLENPPTIQEVAFPNVYNSRSNNFSIVRRIDSVDQMVSQIEFAMPSDLGVCRIHVAGDFFNQVYFDAWLQIAYRHPSRLFYAYTKSIPYWLLRRDSIPSNFILTASLGGRKDSLVFEHGLRYSKVVFRIKLHGPLS